MPQSWSGTRITGFLPFRAEVLGDEGAQVAASGKRDAADTPREGEGVDHAPEQGIRNIGDHHGRPQIGSQDAVADDNLAALQGADKTAGGMRAVDQLGAGLPEPGAIPFGADQPASPDSPGLRRCRDDSAAMGPRAAVVIDIHENQAQKRPRMALAAFTLLAEPGSLTH